MPEQQLTDRMRSALRAAATTHAVVSHGNVVRALIARGLAKEPVALPYGGTGTTVQLTRAGQRLGLLLEAERLEQTNTSTPARQAVNLERAEQLRAKAKELT